MNDKNITDEQEPVLTFQTEDGLTVHLIKKTAFEQTIAALTVKIGSLTTTYQDENGHYQKIPAGSAHFLEHQMFSKPDGDLLIKMADQGADGNAYTSNNVTCYYFSTVNHIRENLALLLALVQEPYFTEKSVTRERGIIEEEIASYQDDPDNILYQGLLKTAYPNQPISQDIAGTPETIRKISADLLYDIHRAYYRPDNMVLTITGDFDEATVKQWVNTIQRSYAGRVKATRQRQISRLKQNAAITAEKQSIKLSVRLERQGILYGITPLLGVSNGIQRELATIVLELAFGEQTDWYQKNYHHGIIGDDFDFEVSVNQGFAYVAFFTSGNILDQQSHLIQQRMEEITSFLEKPLEEFQVVKKGLMGEKILQGDRLLSIALDEDLALYALSLFDKMNLVKQLEQKDLAAYARVAFKQSSAARYIVKKHKNG